jgi:cellulose synthase/poly-beta-1,6-N-acetylglucosamine synthase-like glycosyltransferase
MKFKVLREKILTASSLLAILLFSCTFSCSSDTHIDKEVGKPLVTFIIPTLGRTTLARTIISLQNQQNPNWEAIVVFDGIAPTKMPVDHRIKTIQIEKTGEFNHAGEVRNQGMQHVITEWIAFVDDDDYLSPDYISRLLEEIDLNPSVDVVIFRMYYPPRAALIPSPGDTNFVEANVGVSFSMRTKLYKAGLKFQPSGVEDFKLLGLIRTQGYKMVMSPYVTYGVRETESQKFTEESNCVRAYIN